MGNLIRISVLLFIGIALIGIFFIGNFTETGNTIQQQEYTYTKAICNESNFCQDYIITCENNEVSKKTPITGAITQHSENWIDPRGNNTKEDCES